VVKVNNITQTRKMRMMALKTLSVSHQTRKYFPSKKKKKTGRWKSVRGIDH